MSTPATPPARSSSRFGGCLMVLLAVMAVVVVANVIGSFSGGDDSPSPTEQRVLAERACEGAVEQNLKAPSTARYDSSATGSDPWLVTGIVDAENSFGAMIRSSYSCTVELSGGRMLATLEELGTGR